jgi:Protein of unknown function (DUF4235)
MKILYKPFALISGLIGARLGHTVFKQLWVQLDDSKPPKPTTEEASTSKIVAAAVLEAATLAGVAAVVDRFSARAFERVTGIWPGDRHPEPAEPEPGD